MSVKPENAEEYELPRLRSSSDSSIHDADEAIGDIDEQIRLLSGKDGDRRRNSGDDSYEGAEPEDLSDSDGRPASRSAARDQRRPGEEIKGEGSNIEALIARSVPSTDDPTLPTLTLRVILLGSFFCVLGASASQVFYFKSNAPSFSAYFVILATYPLGHALANERWVPRGKRVFGLELNPGRFSIKEAILVSVLSSSGASSAYATDILAIMDLYFKTPLSAVPSIVLILTTQCIGFGLAGMLQNILVSPPAMYWPSCLVIVQLFTTLYSTTSSRLSRSQRLLTAKRLRIFLLVAMAAFIYQFLPFLFFPTLTSLSVLCLIDNRSWWMRVLGSGYDGLGVLNLSLDWSSIGASGPLYTPYWALGNYFGGLVGMLWVILPLMLVFNFWDAKSFPSPIGSGLYNSSYHKFNVTSVLNSDLSLNTAAWEESKPLLLTPYFAVNYSFSFAALSSVLVHVWLWHRDEIRQALRSKSEMTDVHNTLMRAYKAVPHSWYFMLLGINFGAAVLLVTFTPLQLPVWMLALSILIAAVFLVPVGIINAVSNTTIGLVSLPNGTAPLKTCEVLLIADSVAGIIMPGKPIGNVTFKCFGYMAMSQALSLAGDLKLGWYTSIPPREMFAAQIIGTVLGALANYVTLQSVIASKRPYLDGSLVDPTGQWTGRAPSVFYSASIIWGAVAPARFFAGKYVWLYGGFVLGAIVPVLTWMGHKRYPGWKLHKVVFPIICSGATMVPQYPSNIILTGLVCAVVANGYIAKRYSTTHNRYVYVVSSALDAGTSITALVIYLAFGVLSQWDGPRWWGNPATDSEHCKPGT